MRWKLRALVLNVFLKIHLVNGDDLHFLRNDVMTLAGWGQAATFQTINYQPVCGVLQSGFTNRIDQGTCKTAMSYYKQSSKTYATYNDLGVETKNVPGDGETFCLCFSLKDTAGKMGDFCIAISADGQQVIWWTLSYDSRASGQFMPASNKALPACPEVDLAALSSSLLTGRASTTKETPSSTQTTSSSNTPTQSTTKPSVESDTTLQASLCRFPSLLVNISYSRPLSPQDSRYSFELNTFDSHYRNPNLFQ